MLRAKPTSHTATTKAGSRFPQGRPERIRSSYFVGYISQRFSDSNGNKQAFSSIIPQLLKAPLCQNLSFANADSFII